MVTFYNIPIFVKFSVFRDFILNNINFEGLYFSNDAILISYWLFVLIYIIFMFKVVIPFIYKFICYYFNFMRGGRI